MSEEIELAKVTLKNQIATIEGKIELADNDDLLTDLEHDLERKKLALIELEIGE